MWAVIGVWDVAEVGAESDTSGWTAQNGQRHDTAAADPAT